MNKSTLIITLALSLAFVGCKTTYIKGYSKRTMEDNTMRCWFKSSNGLILPYRMYYNELGNENRIVFMMHGAGERGIDNRSQLKYGINQIAYYADRHGIPVTIIAPQCPMTHFWKDDDMMDAIDELIDDVRRSTLLPTNKVVMTGFSMGGDCAWRCMLRFPDNVGKIVPLCGGPLEWHDDSEYFSVTEDSLGTKVFAVSYADDEVVRNYPGKYVTGIIWTNNPSNDVHYAEHASGGHTYEEFGNEELLKWMLED